MFSFASGALFGKPVEADQEKEKDPLKAQVRGGGRDRSGTRGRGWNSRATRFALRSQIKEWRNGIRKEMRDIDKQGRGECGSRARADARSR